MHSELRGGWTVVPERMQLNQANKITDRRPLHITSQPNGLDYILNQELIQTSRQLANQHTGAANRPKPTARTPAEHPAEEQNSVNINQGENPVAKQPAF